ncbi:hypothetical protein K3495_g7445 [Podosphaera aphanis]|nr:hypothetical protein K3495_g7445 [Podosphaera aphanis]
MHVDDFQVVSPHQSKIDLLMSALYRKYNLKTVSTDLFLGIEISHPAPKILKLSQGQYTRTLLNRHGLTDCKPANMPMERMMEANNDLCSPHEKTEYNSCIGGLQYLSINTRPDIAFAVNHLARFLVNPSNEQMQAARQILRYIAKDPDQGITFNRSNNQATLEAYTDADFAADPSTSWSTSVMLIRLSYSGGVCLYYGGPISWASKKQTSIATSSAEAEYISQAMYTKQGQWFAQILRDLRMDHIINENRNTAHMYGDNQGALALAKNPHLYERSKHIDICYHFVRDLAEKKRLVIDYVPTIDMVADGMTKSLQRVAFERFKRLLGLVEELESQGLP